MKANAQPPAPVPSSICWTTTLILFCRIFSQWDTRVVFRTHNGRSFPVYTARAHRAARLHAPPAQALADVATNAHSFVAIMPNHCGADLWSFGDRSVTPNSGTFFLRQVRTLQHQNLYCERKKPLLTSPPYLSFKMLIIFLNYAVNVFVSWGIFYSRDVVRV